MILSAPALAGLGVPQQLRCEQLENPIGLDAAQPRLSWLVNDDRRGARQTGYQIVVATDPAFQQVVWDTGKVNSDASSLVPYAGPALVSATRYFWKVRTWDTQGNVTPYTPSTWWETGLLQPADWQAQWITVPPHKTEDMTLTWGDWIWNADAAKDNATCYFRIPIDIPADDPVRGGVIKITCDDVFKLFLNGRKVGMSGQWPVISKYNLGDGWQAGRNVLAVESFNGPGNYGLIFSLRLTLASGKTIELRSNPDLKTAVTVTDGWKAIDYDDSDWVPALKVASYGEKWGELKEAPASQRSRYVRKGFTARADITRARAYVTGLGLYELHVNGQRVGKDVFTPGWTRYEDRLQYQTYDVTELVRGGENVVGAVLGNGWWSGGLGWGPETDIAGRQLCLFAQLAVEYADGTRQIIATDPSWKSHLSPITRDTFYHGESHDARLEIPGWDAPGLDETDWEACLSFKAPTQKLLGQDSEPIRVTAERTAEQRFSPQAGVWVFDFGQNASGRVRLKVSAEPGTQVRLRFAEILNPDGTIYRDNYRSAQATDEYICKGGGVEVWEPRFTYRGFRYCEVTGLPGEPPHDTVVMRVLHSAPPSAGSFECSNSLINRVDQCVTWGLISNMHSVPTDCPQRDERLGWMGDAQIFVPTSCWKMQMGPFYRKWLRDITDSQYQEGEHAGAVTDVAPVVVVPGPAKPGWGDAVVIVPWTVYRFYGDTRIIEENYEAMKAWVEYMRRYAPNHLYEREGYGDWVPVVTSPSKPIGSAYYFLSTTLLSRMAQVIGRTDDAAAYAELAEQIAAAYQKAYFNADTAQYEGNTQTMLLLPLYFGITPADEQERVLDNLARDIIARGYSLTTGFLGSAYLMPALAHFGRQDLAWRLAIRTEYPGWGYMILRGATTIWERWNSDIMGPDMNSRNHFAFGAVSQWYYEFLAGIQLDPQVPGFKRFVVAPQPAGDLMWARATYPSPYGQIRVAWQRMPAGIVLQVRVPANSAARIAVPTLGLKKPQIFEGKTAVYADGQPTAAVPEVRFVELTSTAAVFSVPAGQYDFALVGE